MSRKIVQPILRQRVAAAQKRALSLVLHSFTNDANGANPYAGLVQASPNTFYGATFDGRAALDGTLFKLTSSGAFTPLYSFGGGFDGANPLAALVQGSDGKLYGLTCTGGANDLGTVFSLTTNGGVTSLVSFDYALGAYPSNGLVQASDGDFYGAASHGGTNGGWGAVFRVTADGALTALHSFNWLDGAYPTGGLLQGTDGNLYGTTSQGGVGGGGTVSQITTNGQFTTLVWFNGPNGAGPQASLIQARNGLFYGTTEFGGTGYDGAPGSGDGLVFRLILPLFVSQTINFASATVGQPYAASLANNAVSPPGDSLTFAKVSGPVWLSVDPDGTLSGTPAVPDIGTNTLTVTLADTKGWTSSATMRIVVVPAPLLASLSVSQGTNVQLSWSGGLPPYQVLMASDLLNPPWQNVGSPTTNTTLLLTPTNAAAFYRIHSR